MSKTVGIFCAGQRGDIMTAMSVLKYRNELWGDAKIVWYADEMYFDLFKHQNIEVREFPRGFGYPEMVFAENQKLVKDGKEPVWEDWKPLVTEDNHMDIEPKKNYPSLADIDFGYFPAPHQLTPIQRHGLDYPSCSKRVFGIPDSYLWHPYLLFSDDEREATSKFIEGMGTGKKVLIETYAGSGQSILDEGMICEAMNLCLEHWGANCNFVFASHKFLKKNEDFPQYLFEQPNVFSCANFTVRQCALIAGGCDLMISVSSGITVAASCWDNKPIPIIQFTGSWVCSTKTLANGEFKLVTADDKKTSDAKKQFYENLIELLKKYK